MLYRLTAWLARRGADKELARTLEAFLRPDDGWTLTSEGQMFLGITHTLKHDAWRTTLTVRETWYELGAATMQMGEKGLEVPPGIPLKAVHRAFLRLRKDYLQRQADAHADNFEKSLAHHILSL